MEITKGDWIHDHDGVFSEEKGLVGNVICESPESFGESMKNWDANGKLIAAAPNLLAACQAALRHHQGGHSEIGDILKEAIKKATE